MIVLLCIVALLALVVIGFREDIRIPVLSYYKETAREFKIPDVNNGFIPQGISYNEKDGNFLVCGYWNDKTHASPIYTIDKDGKLIASAMLADSEGKTFTGHAGGVTVHGDYVYLAGSSKGCVYVFDYNEIVSAGKGGTVKYLGTFNTKTDDDKIRVSFTATDGKMLYVGEYYKEQGYNTPDTHKLTTTAGEAHGGLALGYEFSDAPDAVFGLKETPSVAYSLPDIAQGMCFDGGKVYVSCSAGLDFSHIYGYNVEKAATGKTIDILGCELPLYELDKASMTNTLKLAPMSEEIDVKDGRIYIMCEAASNKFFYGKLTGATKCYSYPLDKMPAAGDGNKVSPSAEPISITKYGDFDSKLNDFIASVNGGKENYMISPLSFKYALALLTEGASGETKTELLTALGMTNTDELEAELSAFEDFAVRFESFGKNNKIDDMACKVANSVWKSSELVPVDFYSSYTDKLFSAYGSEFRSFTKQSVKPDVNAWVNKKTNGMIPSLLPDSYNVNDLAMILMNALYFKDSWQNSFYETSGKTDFTAYDGSKTEKKYITSKEHYLYYSDKNTELVSVSMNGGVSMLFVIGDTENVFAKLEKAKTATVRVTIPELDVESSFSNGEFVAFLRSAGVSRVFDASTCDLSAMLDISKLDGNLYVSDIIQKTKLKLDKNGVEAAAVTAIMVNKETAVMNPEKVVDFTADKPFSFYIYSNFDSVKTIMFEGKIVK